MTDHRIPFGATGWSLWRWVCLRGAGFPAAGTRALGADSLAAALAEEASFSDRERQAWLVARAAVRSAVDAAKAAGADPTLLKRAANRLSTHRLPQEPIEAPQAAAAIDALRAAIAEHERAKTTVDAEIAAARVHCAEALQAVARDPRFCEALVWQNRDILGAVAALVRAEPAADNSELRKARRAIARYYQRYALKNDTIGFFGPNGWGHVDAELPGLVAHPGESFLELREVFFEDWAIAAVAARLSTDPDVRNVFAPRRRPSSWLDGSTLHAPPAAPRQLSPAEAWLVARADGQRLVRDLVAAAVADPTSELPSADAAIEVLERLARENAITWGLEVPAEVEHGERLLRAQLERLDDEAVRTRALEPLDRLEAARAKVAAAAGDHEALQRTVAELEATFQSVTEVSAKRGHGRTYAGRQVFFEDTRRAIDLRVGRALLDELQGPLSLLLQSARWFSYEIAQRFYAECETIFAGMNEPRVPLTMMLSATRRLFSADQYHEGPIVAAVRAELRRRWGEVLDLEHADLSARSLEVSVEQCRDRVAQLFAAPHPGWPRARYHAPDVMIAARSAAHVDRGEFLAVLGELHAGINTLQTHMGLHPDPAVLDAAYDADMERVCIAPIQSGANRAMSTPLSPRHLHVEFGATRSWRPRAQVLLAGDLVVERAGERLCVRDRAGAFSEDLVAFMDHYLSSEAAPHFKIVDKARHVPRVAIGKLVVSRERWHLARADFEGLLTASIDDPVRRVAAWARALGLPRLVFGSVPSEPKPFYVDFASPILVDLFVRYLEDAPSLGITEMLPAHDELWLTDRAGNTYTSELRLAAVDPVPWKPSPTRD